MDQNIGNGDMLENPEGTVPQEPPKKTFGDKAKDFISDYQNAKDFKQMAKNIIGNKSGDKKGLSKDKGDDKNNSILPESVRKKREETKGKNNLLQSKKQGKNNKDGQQQPQNQLKAQVNEKVFREGIKRGVDLLLPGAGEAAGIILDTPKGQPAVEAARNAPDPVRGIKEGVKKLVAVLVKDQLKQQFLPPLIGISCVLIILIIIISVTFKAASSFDYFQGNGSGISGIDAVGEEYKEFYEAVEDYGSANRHMVVAVLTAHTDNDDYIGELDTIVDSCTEAQIASGECSIEVKSGLTIYSISDLKKYIKKVNKAINESGGDITEGDYKDPQNTGSEFFRWLYNDFVEEYYSEFINSETSKEEIIREIYLLYESLLGNTCSSGAGGYDTSCDFNLTKVKVKDCSGEKVMAELDLKTYLLGVTLGEIDNLADDENTFKAFIIVAKTYALQKSAGYDSSTKEISMLSCEKNQVWCDIENGCNKYKYKYKDESYLSTYSKAYPDLSGGETYKQPLSSERKEKWSKWYDEVYPYLYLDRNKFKGPITKLQNIDIGYSAVQQNYWYEQSTKYNKKFDEVFAGTPSSNYFHFDSLEGEDLGIYDLGSYCKKISGGSTVAGKYVYYSQGKEPWRSMKHGCGSGESFAAKGCFQTSSAMVLSSMLGREITPKDTNDYTASNRANSCSGTTSNYSHFTNVAKNYGLSVKLIPNATPTSAQTMLDELAKGNLITQILSCPKGGTANGLCQNIGRAYGHAIVIVPGSKAGYVTILDSITPERPTHEITAEEAVVDKYTKNSFYVWSLKDSTVVSGNIDSNNSNLVTAGGLSNACTYTPNNTKYNESIYVGDSRTVGMCSAASISDKCIAEVGKGYDWLSTTGLNTLKGKLDSNPNVNVMINMGTNDLDKAESYASLYKQLSTDYPSTNFIVMSVTQIDDDLAKNKGYNATNAQVVSFNSTLKSKLPSKVKYCDIYTKLDGNYKTTDGIHYDNDTYKKIFELSKNC